MLKFAALAILFAVSTGPALAAAHCDVPTDEWQPRETLKTKLEGHGWTVHTIRSRDGCYAADVTDVRGRRVETFFDPRTLEPVGTEDRHG